MTAGASRIKVLDEFGAAADPALESIALALDPVVVRAEFKHRLPRLAGEDGWVRVRSIRVLRHKPGKRCVIEYDIRIKSASAEPAKAVLIGKIRSRRFGNEGYRLLDDLWRAGFQADSADGVSVPEPIGVLTSLRMWLQRKVPGVVVSDLIAGPEGIALGRRIAEAIHKLHRAGVPVDREHTMCDELRILHECLPRAAQLRPELAARIERLLAGCDRLGAGLPAPRACGIHRDFYPAQVIAEPSRLHLIDFDLYCQGDPALDVGNFIGHITEESLRTLGDARALEDREEAIVDRFGQLSGAAAVPAIRVYSTLTLARHVYLTTQFPDRATFTERLLELCEQRLAAAGVA